MDRLTLSVMLGALLFAITPAAAQAGGGTGTISGTVIDASTEQPLAGAIVSLEAEDGNVLAGGSGGGSFLSRSLNVATSPEGGYRFERLPAGRYRVLIRRTGYRPENLAVELRGDAESRVSVGLTIEPVQLQSVDVPIPPAEPFGQTRQTGIDAEAARVRAAESRIDASLSTDTRELTQADLLQSVTLGETDLFRAFQKVPGVQTRDDFSAELWVRGAPWDQTRVIFDGLPLYNPVHAFGLFSATNPDAIGGALLHPGVRPAEIGEGSAAAVNVTSRSGSDAGEDVDVILDFSVASAKVAFDRRSEDGRIAYMIALRRSWIDIVGGLLSRAMDDPELSIPFSFQDQTARLDFDFGRWGRIEMSSLFEQDEIRDDIPDVLHGNHARWGNGLARVGHVIDTDRFTIRNSLGATNYWSNFDERDYGIPSEYDAPTEPFSRGSVVHTRLFGRMEPRAGGTGAGSWATGYEIQLSSTRYDGPPTRYAGGVRPDSPSTLSMDSRLDQLGVWGSRRWQASERTTLETGLRAETGGGVVNAAAVRLSPRIAVRHQISPEIALSAGLGRHYQYTQAIGNTGPVIGSIATSSQLWMTASEGFPAILSDIATLGAEAWTPLDVIVSLNGYLRRSGGIAIQDPTPGLLDERPLFVQAGNSAHGVEASLRRLTGPLTFSAGYAWGVSETEAAGLRFPSSADRRHSLDVTAMMDLGRGFRAGTAYTLASGAPFTRVFSPVFSCQSSDCDQRPRLLQPNAQRTSAYSSLDLLLESSRLRESSSSSFYVQFRNVLRRKNQVTYTSTTEICPGLGYTSQCPTDFQLVDQFQQGLPFLAVAGFRITF